MANSVHVRHNGKGVILRNRYNGEMFFDDKVLAICTKTDKGTFICRHLEFGFVVEDKRKGDCLKRLFNYVEDNLR